VAIVGGGPAGLMAAEALACAGISVQIYDRMPTVGRKFLMAGRGGLNLTHSEPLDAFLGRYGPARDRLAAAIEAFPPTAARAWCEDLGQPTFVGSSGRVFPRALKASPLLRAWLGRLAAAGVGFHLRRRWTGWDDQGRLSFEHEGGIETVEADAVLLALGGASWPRLGSDGGWAGLLAARGIAIAPLRPANCGFLSAWSEVFRTRFAGSPIKTATFSFGARRLRGEAVITAGGIEGSAVYALSAELREAIAAAGRAVLHIDLCPDLPVDEVARRLSRPRSAQSQSTFLKRTLGLPPAAIGLLHEAEGASLPTEAGRLAGLIKAVPITLTAPAPLSRAISTAGGIALDEVTGDYMLRALPGVFVAGEMLDWEAPTGGYLLQACLATGLAAAKGIEKWLAAPSNPNVSRHPRESGDPSASAAGQSPQG
jgi:uncharacterized flavoprotein (TIGR03862 family)